MIQCWVNVVPLFMELFQHWANIVSVYRVSGDSAKMRRLADAV